jgi:hypothetical protein
MQIGIADRYKEEKIWRKMLSAFAEVSFMPKFGHSLFNKISLTCLKVAGNRLER